MEDLTHYDPFKSRIIAAISQGLSEASIDHETILENEIYNQQKIEFLRKDQYPYKPDIILGYKG